MLNVICNILNYNIYVKIPSFFSVFREITLENV